jgi:malate dehydrogenase
MKVSILGADDFGATVAQKLADADWPGEIVLYDADKGRALGKGLDLLQANPVFGSCTFVRGTQDLGEIRGSSYIVVTEADPDSTTQIVDASEQLAPDSVILAGAECPGPLLRRALKSSKIDPRRVLGSAPEAFASVWRRTLGALVRCSPQDVQVSLLGAPPKEGLYVSFASLAGRPVEQFLSVPQMREAWVRMCAHSCLGTRVLASAAVEVLKSMAFRDGAVRSCHAWADGVYGARCLFLCAPTVLGPDGSRRIIEFPLDPRETVALSRALEHLSCTLQ